MQVRRSVAPILLGAAAAALLLVLAVSVPSRAERRDVAGGAEPGAWIDEEGRLSAEPDALVSRGGHGALAAEVAAPRPAVREPGREGGEPAARILGLTWPALLSEAASWLALAETFGIVLGVLRPRR